MNEYKEWGKWVRHDPDRLSAKSSWGLVMRDNIPMGYDNYRMTDERGCQIDAAVASLASYSKVCAHVFVMTYVYGWSRDKIAKEYMTELMYQDLGRKATRFDVKDRLLVAEGYVTGIANYLLKC